MKPYPVKRDGKRSIKAPQSIQSFPFAKRLEHTPENRLNQRGVHRIEQRAHVVVGGYLVDAEDRAGVTLATAQLHHAWYSEYCSLFADRGTR